MDTLNLENGGIGSWATAMRIAAEHGTDRLVLLVLVNPRVPLGPGHHQSQTHQRPSSLTTVSVRSTLLPVAFATPTSTVACEPSPD